jgi:hypothetical protein
MQITTNINHYQRQVAETERAYETAQAELETQKQTLEVRLFCSMLNV